MSITNRPPAPPGGPETPQRANRFGTKLFVLLLHDGQELPCTLENLSRSGVLLGGRREWPEAVETTIVIRSASGDLQVPVRVRVVRRVPSSPTGDGPKLAAAITETDPDTLEGIEFLLQRVIEASATGDELPEIRPGTSPREVRALLDAVPPVRRIALAGRVGPKGREVLLQDHHPQVLESLARNAGLLAREARALAASHHVSATALTILAADGRFAGDEEMKIRILASPRVPVPLAERLVQSMQPAALRRALQRPGMNAAVQAAIVRRLSR